MSTVRPLISPAADVIHIPLNKYLKGVFSFKINHCDLHKQMTWSANLHRQIFLNILDVNTNDKHISLRDWDTSLQIACQKKKYYTFTMMLKHYTEVSDK